MGSYYLPPSGSQINQHETYGSAGKFVDPILITANTTVNFTGSNYGYGAVSVTDSTNVEITASNGATLLGSDFAVKTIHEVGLRRIKIAATGRAIAYKIKGM